MAHWLSTKTRIWTFGHQDQQRTVTHVSA